jgi:hypothetical protein
MLGDDGFLSHIWDLAGQRPAQRRRMGAQNDNLIRRTLVKAIRRFRRLCGSILPPRQASAWSSTLSVARVCAMSRKHPLPMLRALCVSYLLEQHLATRLQAARFFGCRPETLSAGRRRRHESSFRYLFSQPYSILFESERRRIAPSMTRPSPRDRHDKVSISNETRDEPLEDFDFEEGALRRNAAPQPSTAVRDHLLSTYAARYFSEPVRVPRRVSNIANARSNRTQVSGWGTRDRARPICRQTRQGWIGVASRSAENRSRR